MTGQRPHGRSPRAHRHPARNCAAESAVAHHRRAFRQERPRCAAVAQGAPSRQLPQAKVWSMSVLYAASGAGFFSVTNGGLSGRWGSSGETGGPSCRARRPGAAPDRELPRWTPGAIGLWMNECGVQPVGSHLLYRGDRPHQVGLDDGPRPADGDRGEFSGRPSAVYLYRVRSTGSQPVRARIVCPWGHDQHRRGAGEFGTARILEYSPALFPDSG